MKRLLVALVMAVAGIAATAPPCWACTCAPATKEEKAERADVVFFGKVRAVEAPEPDDVYGDDNIKVRIRVKTVYKGESVRRNVTVRTNESGASCGYEGFKVGSRYTVFGERRNGKIFTNLCSGTKKGNINPDNYGLPEGEPPKS